MNPIDRWVADLIGLGYVRAIVGERTETIEPALAETAVARRSS